jgi:hypothetical protein
MLQYNWAIQFFLPGAPLSEPMQVGDLNLRPAEPDQQGHSGCTGSFVLKLGECLTEREAAALATQHLEMVGIAASAMGGSVRGPEVVSLRLENVAELEAAGMRTPGKGGQFRMFVTVMARPLDERRLITGYQAVTNLPVSRRQLWHLAARWLWKANSERDPFDQMLALWISFNVLYGPYMSDSEQQAIEEYVIADLGPSSAQLVKEIGRHTLGRLVDSRLTLRSGKNLRRIGSDLQNGLSQPIASPIASAQLLKLVLLTIYAVRCAIVHTGTVVPERDREIVLISTSAIVLKALIMHALRTELGL